MPAALEVLQRDAPAVLVVDLRLSGEDGYELIRRLRAAEAADRRPIAAVAITGYGRIEDRARALVAGLSALRAEARRRGAPGLGRPHAGAGRRAGRGTRRRQQPCIVAAPRNLSHRDPAAPAGCLRGRLE